jgi:hypothetical protein
MFEITGASDVAGPSLERLLISGTPSGCESGAAPGSPDEVTGIRVAGASLRLSNVAICGFGKALEVTDARHGGHMEAAAFVENGVALDLSGAVGWTFDALQTDRNRIAVIARRSEGIRIFGGLITKSSQVGINLEGCRGCDLSGIEYAGNAVDVQLGGAAGDRVQNVELASSIGASAVRIVNPGPACPVDRVSFLDFAGRAGPPRAPVSVTVDAACATHVSLRQSEVNLVTRNSFGPEPPEVIVFEASGFATSPGVMAGALGVPGGLDIGDRSPFQAVSMDRSGRPPDPARSFRVFGDGHAALGGQRMDAVLSVTAPAGTEAASTRALRFVAVDGSSRASIEGTEEADGGGRSTEGLAIRTSSGGRQAEESLRVTPSGRVGIGTSSPRATLEVAGGVRAAGAVRAELISVPIGDASDPCDEPGRLEIVPAADQLGTDRLRLCGTHGWVDVSMVPP